MQPEDVRKYFLTPVIITFKEILRGPECEVRPRVWRWGDDVCHWRERPQLRPGPADTVWCNEALADLTNSSLIQNSSHRQFHIISRSRTLLQPPSHCCNSDCSRRVQPRFFLSNFYKNMESWSQKGHWGVRRRGENCGHNNRTSILGVIQTIRCNWLRLDWKSQISHKFPFYLLHLPQNWGNSHISRSVSVGAYKKLPHRPKVLDPALLRCFIYFVSSFARARTSRVFASTGQHAVTPRSRMKPLNATDQSLISPLLLDKIDEFVCPLFEDLWSKVLPEEMIFVFHRWLGAGAGPVPVTQRSLMMSLYLFSHFIIFFYCQKGRLKTMSFQLTLLLTVLESIAQPLRLQLC